MDKSLSLIVLGTLVFLAHVNAKPIPEKSDLGKFDFKQIKEGCEISFIHNNGQNYHLISNGYCSDTGLNRLGPIGTGGGLKFPFQSACNEEVHMFSTETAGGGNACEGATFWVAFITKDGAWATKEIGGCTGLETIGTGGDSQNCRLTLVLKDPKNSMSKKYEVDFNVIRKANPVTVGEMKNVQLAMAEFNGVKANWETLQSAYQAETNVSGNFWQIGFQSPKESKYWMYYDKEEIGKLYIQNKNPMLGCPANNIWVASHNSKSDRINIANPSTANCASLNRAVQK